MANVKDRFRDAQILHGELGAKMHVQAEYIGDLMVHKSVNSPGWWSVSVIDSGYFMLDAPTLHSAENAAMALQYKFSFDPDDPQPAEKMGKMSAYAAGVQAMALYSGRQVDVSHFFSRWSR